MTAWTVIAVAGAGSFAFRLSIVALIDHVATPDWLERLAAYVMPAAFAGIAAASLAGPVGTGGTDALAPIVAVSVTTALSIRGRSIQAAFLYGLAALWITTALAAQV